MDIRVIYSTTGINCLDNNTLTQTQEKSRYLEITFLKVNKMCHWNIFLVVRSFSISAKVLTIHTQKFPWTMLVWRCQWQPSPRVELQYLTHFTICHMSQSLSGVFLCCSTLFQFFLHCLAFSSFHVNLNSPFQKDPMILTYPKTKYPNFLFLEDEY